MTYKKALKHIKDLINNVTSAYYDCLAAGGTIDDEDERYLDVLQKAAEALEKQMMTELKFCPIAEKKALCDACTIAPKLLKELEQLKKALELACNDIPYPFGTPKQYLVLAELEESENG